MQDPNKPAGTEEGATEMHAAHVQRQVTTTTEAPAVPSPSDLISACRSNAAILFTGATAVAESVARDIHTASGWRQGPFVVVDCRIRESELIAKLAWLLSDELASRDYTEATPRRSQNGIVFLRDVDHLSPLAQGHVYEWLAALRSPGKPNPRCRVMASTTRPLLPRSLGGTFHDGLYYRLNVIQIKLDANSDN
jgi:DNA-binding NtrC family response regulator